MMDNKTVAMALAIAGGYWYLTRRKRRNPISKITKPTTLEVEQLVAYRRGTGSNMARSYTDIPAAKEEIRRLEARERRIASEYRERNASPASRAEYARRVAPIRKMVEQLEEAIHQTRRYKYGLTDERTFKWP